MKKLMKKLCQMFEKILVYFDNNAIIIIDNYTKIQRSRSLNSATNK